MPISALVVMLSEQMLVHTVEEINPLMDPCGLDALAGVDVKAITTAMELPATAACAAHVACPVRECTHSVWSAIG